MEKFRGHLKISELPFDPTDITTKVDFGFRYNGSGINQGLQKEMSKRLTDISETIFLHEFLSLSGVSIDQIKTNKQNFTKVAVDNLMEKKTIHHIHKVV